MGFAKQAIETYQAFVKLVEESLADLKIQKHIIIKSYRPIPRRDSISRPIAPVTSEEGGDDTSRPSCQGKMQAYLYFKSFLSVHTHVHKQMHFD
jgi:hypothetical protein